jgi:hypothetical protein
MSTGSSSPVVFDLLSERGIIDLLAVIRASALSTPEKRVLRDLVLSYAQSKGDKNLYKELNEKISTFKLSRDVLIKSNDTPAESSVIPGEAAVVTDEIIAKPRSGFSSGRSTPVFYRATPTNQLPKQAEEPAIEASKPVAVPPVVPDISIITPAASSDASVSVSQSSHPVAEMLPDSVSQSQVFSPHIHSHSEISPVAATESTIPPSPIQATEPPLSPPAQSSVIPPVQAVSLEGPTSTPQNIPSRLSVPVDLQEEPVIKSNTAPSAPLSSSNSSASLPTVDTSANKYLLRIQEIKSDINQKIGNPVNLVDIDNAIGREYMSALLESMKSLSSGGDINNAMSRLETAYTAALRVMDSPSSRESVTPSTSVPDTEVVVISPVSVQSPDTPQVASSATPVPIISVPRTPDTTPTAIAPSLEPVASVNNVANTSSAIPVTVNAQNENRITPIIPNLQSTTSLGSNASVLQNTAPSFKAPINISTTPHVATDIPQAASSDLNPPITPIQSVAINSVADAPPLKNISELPLANQVQTAPTGTDPLFTKEIDEGLDQLLAEWPLFSRSGLFGRGPNRREHPLFIQLSNMPIPLILTGRFEGATPQVMQSISDYMNGWRYEQGLVYDADESFEHFLRRVIRHIINWQRKKKVA